jgi:hypothetical protein
MRLPSLLSGRRTSDECAPEDESWVDRGVAGCQFQDVRLGERFRKLLKQSCADRTRHQKACRCVRHHCALHLAAGRYPEYENFTRVRVNEGAPLAGWLQDVSAELSRAALLRPDPSVVDNEQQNSPPGVERQLRWPAHCLARNAPGY